jgi:hypothetical protein
VCGDHGADYCQTETAAGADGGVSRAFASDEAVEDLSANLRGDARTVIGYLDHRIVAVRTQAQFDSGARGRVAGRVVEQVEHHSVQFVGIAVDLQRVVVLDLQLAIA